MSVDQPKVKQVENDRPEQDDIRYMRQAMACAEKGRQPGGSPIGCVIVLDDRVIAEGYNEVELRCDPTAHAEMVCIRRACEALRAIDIRGATLYSTLQPCGMCSMASIWGKVGRIVYGASRKDVHEMYFEQREGGTVDYVLEAYRDDMTVLGGVLSDECANFYYGPDDYVPDAEKANL